MRKWSYWYRFEKRSNGDELDINGEIDVITELLSLLQKGGRITRTSKSLISDSGLPYYFVEITKEDGCQYALQAYGQEALALYKSTLKITRIELSEVSTKSSE